MGAVAVLKTVKIIIDFIPDPVKRPVSTLLEISITICERVEQVTENVQAVADLAEQQAGIAADVVSELRGVTEAQIVSGNWVPRLKKLTATLEKVRDLVFKDSEDVERESKSTKAVTKAMKALANLWNSEEKKKEIDTLKAELDETREELKLQLGIATLVGVQHITEIVRELMQSHDKTLVHRLEPTMSARYDALRSPGGCLPGTRLALRDDLRKLLTADDEQRIVWLSGLAGTGKSTVARSICSDLKDTHDVVSFFIERGCVDRSDQKRTLQTLVYQLSQCIPEVFSAVLRAKDEVFGARIHDQVNDLVLGPLSAASPGARPVVIIIDAADELDDTTQSGCDDTTPSECDLIHCVLHAIAKAKLPSIHVLVTSRGRPSDFLDPTYDSEASHDPPDLLQGVVKDVSIHDKSYHPDNDIRAYFAAQFKRIAKKQRLRHWQPSPDQIDDLVKMSAQLFIFAVTVIRWVDGPAVEFSLGQFLTQSFASMERSGTGTIFALYEYVIDHALAENIPQQLLRSVLGKNPDDGTEVHALEVTLSILSTLLCLHEPLTPNVFAQLWAGHLIAEPTLHRGAVTIAEHLISRLSGVLFVWEPDSSMALLHASFGDFLDARSSGYHISSETTHFELASKCVNIMLSTKAAYSQCCGASSEYPLLNHRLDVIPWIPSSDLVARYSFAQWFLHACRAPHRQLPLLLQQVCLAERGFWFAGVFLQSRGIHERSLWQILRAMLTHREGVVAAYTLATVIHICADEGSDFQIRNSRSLGLSSFNLSMPLNDSLSTVTPFDYLPGFDDPNPLAEPLDRLDHCLRQVLITLEQWRIHIQPVDRKTLPRFLLTRFENEMQECIASTVLNLKLATTATEWLAFSQCTGSRETGNSFGNWPSNFSTIIENLIDVVSRLGWCEEEVKSTPEELERWAKQFRYALRELRYHILNPVDEQVFAVFDRRNAGRLTNEPTHEDDTPLDSSLYAGHSLGVDAPLRPERQSLQVDEELPPELHCAGNVDPNPSEGQSLLVDEPHLSEGQSSQDVTRIPHEERATVTTSAASTVGFFAVLVLLYVLLSSLFA